MRRLSTVLLPLALAFALAASARAVPLRTGDLLVVTDFGVVYTVDRATGATQHFADLPISSGGHLAFDAAGNVLVQARASAEAFRIDRNTGAVSSLASGAFLAGSNGNSSGIAFDSDQGLILDSTFMVSPTSIKGRVVRVDAGGTQTLVSEGIYFPNALTTEADGSILVASDFLFLGAGTSYNNGVVFRIDPATGAISVVASGGNLSPPGSARDLAIADDGAIAAVAGPSCSRSSTR